MAALQVLVNLTILAILVQTAMGTNYGIGGAGGWSLGANLQSWAAAQSFRTGDTITFVYGSFHNVVEVSKAEFDACSMSNPIRTYSNGNTIIKLSSLGKRYFVCGAPGHCSGGMKVVISTGSSSARSPSLPPSESTMDAPSTSSSPSLVPVLTPNVAPPAIGLSETAPAPQESAAKCFSSPAKIKLGLATSILMALVL